VLPIIATIFTITIYILFSTLFHNSSIVGVAGKAIGEGNIYLFGYVAYFNFIFILFPLYEIYKNPTLLKKKDIYVGWGLLLVSILILQGLIFRDNGGVISATLYSALVPNIGNAGLFFIFLLTATLSYTIINTDGIYNIIDKLKDNSFIRFFKNIKENLFGIEPIKKENDIKDIVIPKRVKSRQPRDIEQPKPKKLPKKESTKRGSTKDSAAELSSTKKSQTKSSQTPKEPQSSIIVDELEENAKLLEDIELGKLEKPKNFKLPPLSFLQTPPKSIQKVNEAEIDRKIGELLEKLRLFKIDGDVVRTYTGPLVTTFEFKPAPHVKVSKILNLQDDLAMALSAETIRIQAPIPGRDVVGIEIPNDEFQTIYLKEILESKIFKNSKSPLTVALGKDIVGKPFVTDLQKLPHLLIAGTTGSGKSVGINAMILSLLYRNSPDDLKMILIDPKMLEFSIYNDIPHLLTPVIIEPKKAVIALANLVSEMERRYKLMAQEKVKNIDNYNQKAKKSDLEKLPFIVVIIDELADLMMTAGKEVEYSIGRLAQMARAAGIHIIVATQRPSVDVVTGLIKANLPARLSYRVGQKIDSKVILDAMGADALLGRGDALFTPPGITGLVRLHAPWNTEEEIEDIVEFLKAQQEPDYDESYLRAAGDSSDEAEVGALDLDPLFEKAKEVVLTDRKSSISYLQRKLQIGYNRSANIVEQLEKMGVLSAPNAKGNREILL
jgi:S-DNA-T family DNA segregation ATPase FtsK/SpoIIIE